MRVIGILALLLAAPVVQAAEPSLASRVPADVGFFVEARDAADLLAPLTDPEIWATLAEIAGQPAEPADVTEWIARIRRTIHMEPAEAIRVLLAKQAAFVGEAPGRSPDAVVLCRPTESIPQDQLLRRWEARLADPAGDRVHELSGGVAVAMLDDDVLAFGDLRPAEGMFRSILSTARGGSEGSLAADPAFARLLKRVPPKPTALLFARLSREAPPASTQPIGAAAATQPAGLGAPWAAGTNVLAALHRNGSTLHLTLVSDAPRPDRKRDASNPDDERRVTSDELEGAESASVLRHSSFVPRHSLTATLPTGTLGSWEGRIDPRQVVGQVRALPPRNALRVIMHLLEQTGSVEQFTSALDGGVCVAVGAVEPSGRLTGAPPIPAAALLLSTRDELAAAREVNTLVESIITVHDFLSLAQGVPPLPRAREVIVEGVPAVLLDASRLLEPFDDGTVRELHLCWTVFDGVTIVATHIDWMRQILAARVGAAERIALEETKGESRITNSEERIVEGPYSDEPRPEASGRPPHPNSLFAIRNSQFTFDNLIFLNGPAVARISQRWLDHLAARAPHVLEERWWRDRQPGGGQVTLGIDVTPLPERRRLRVETVQRGAAAEGFLRPGDYLIGAQRRRFSSDDPVAEIRERIANRPHARWVELLVERSGVASVVRIPVPFVNPIQTLRLANVIGRHTVRIVYMDDMQDPAGLVGRLTVELRESE